MTTDTNTLPAPQLPTAEIAGEGLDRPPWLEVRRAGIGSSDIAAILGIAGAWGTPVTVWQSKLTPGFETPDNPLMAAGRRLEQPIAEWFSGETGIETFNPHPITIYRSKHLPIAQASPDRLTMDATAWVEIKNAHEAKLKDWAMGPPPHYAAQCQWELAVSGLAICYLVVLIGGHDFRYYIIEADMTQQRAMFDAAERFWEHVVDGTVPEVDESDMTRRALMAHFSAPLPKSAIEGGEDLRMALLEYRDADERAKLLRAELVGVSEELTLAKNRALALIGNHEVGLVDGIPACSYPLVERGGYEVQATSYRQLHVDKKWVG